MVACGSGEMPNTNEPQTSENTGGIEPDNTVTTDDNTQLESSSKFLPYLCGEWKVLNIEDKGVLESVIITEDSSINIDGNNFKLRLQSDYENGSSFEVIDGRHFP